MSSIQLRPRSSTPLPLMMPPASRFPQTAPRRMSPDPSATSPSLTPPRAPFPILLMPRHSFQTASLSLPTVGTPTATTPPTATSTVRAAPEGLIDDDETKRTRALRGHRAREWHAKFSLGWVASHGDRILRRLEKDVFPWLKWPIAEVKAPELLAVLCRIESRGAQETAHRAMQNCGQSERSAI